jgi:uridine kinase
VRYDLALPADRQVLDALAEQARGAAPRCGDTVVVAVDGPSGSGKTTLATHLARALPAPLVFMDDLYPGWDGLPQAVGLVTNQVLEPLSRGERAAYRRWDWNRGDWGTWVCVTPAGFLVVEGCGSSVRPAGEYAALRLWVDADPDVRMRRGIERDGETYRPHWQRWARQEAALFEADRTRERADVVIDTTPQEGSTMPRSP